MKETLCPHCPAVIKESDTTCPSCGLAVVGKPTLSAKDIFKFWYREERIYHTSCENIQAAINYGELRKHRSERSQQIARSSSVVVKARLWAAKILLGKFDEIPF